MSNDLSLIGADWLGDQVGGMTDEIIHVLPSVYSEEVRYLPESVTSQPGYMRWSVNPFMREIVDCFDIDSPVREVNLVKGVQITYSTLLESGLLYFMAHVKTLPCMYITADKELAAKRLENNILPMLHGSDMYHIIRSGDEGNARKTGNTAKGLSWEGGGYLTPFGARNADKMRDVSICLMLKDEIDGWPQKVGDDGDPDALTDDRCSGYWPRRKIFRGSTPLTIPSRIQGQFLRGDQRYYMVLCRACSFPQVLKWTVKDKNDQQVGGFFWEIEEGELLLDSVRYRCPECGHDHYEHDKERLFAEDHGAHWKPTARPVEFGIRSYKLPALYSPIGMQPWYKSVSMWLKAWDVDANELKDSGKLQVFYNNVLAEPYEVKGSKVYFAAVSAHRRTVYRLGEIPNKYAIEFSGSRILFLTCVVDVHKRNLAVAVIGWTRGFNAYVIEYWRFECEDGEDDCDQTESPVWGRLREVIEEAIYVADDGAQYRIILTLVDAGYANDTVTTFCSPYGVGVHPILGRDRPSKNQTIKEFAGFTTQAGTVGYRITVDHYKDRLAPVLRREWTEEAGRQKMYHFNAPVDMTDKQLKELTKETRREETDARGNTFFTWYRPGNARNELWDLLVYGHASVEILANMICIEHFELEAIDWPQFWDYLEAEELYFSP